MAFLILQSILLIHQIFGEYHYVLHTIIDSNIWKKRYKYAQALYSQFKMQIQLGPSNHEHNHTKEKQVFEGTSQSLVILFPSQFGGFSTLHLQLASLVEFHTCNAILWGKYFSSLWLVNKNLTRSKVSEFWLKFLLQPILFK